VSWAIVEKGYTQRRACGLIGLAPKTYRYASSRSDDAALRVQLKELASERRRFGYRRLHILLKRVGVAINHKKLFRLYREERLTVRRRGGRKRALGTRAPMTLHKGGTSDGASTSSPTRCPTAGVFGCSKSSTTSRENAWRSSSTYRSMAGASRVSWTRSSCAAASH